MCLSGKALRFQGSALIEEGRFGWTCLALRKTLPLPRERESAPLRHRAPRDNLPERRASDWKDPRFPLGTADRSADHREQNIENSGRIIRENFVDEKRKIGADGQF